MRKITLNNLLWPILLISQSSIATAQEIPTGPSSQAPISQVSGNSVYVSQQNQTPYTLGPGDIIALDIFNVPEYSQNYQVLVDGSLNLPLINRVDVAGLTLPEAQELITRVYTEQQLLVDPLIAVNLIAPRPVNVSVTGDVRNPGSYAVPFRQGTSVQTQTSLEFPSVIDALKIAQGINASADAQNIEVIRTFKGREMIFVVNLEEFLNSGDLSQDIGLRDGDRIIVPSAELIDLARVRRRATADFSANFNVPIQVSIVGQVNRPGPYIIDDSDVKPEELDDRLRFDNVNNSNDGTIEQKFGVRFATTTRAIQFAGGLTGRADVRNIEVRRQLLSGEEQVIKVNLWELLQTGDLNEDTLLQNGDVIVVPTAETINVEETREIGLASFSPNNINVNVVGEVENPGPKELSPNVTLQQAILAAGSFDNVRAAKIKAELIRLNPDGTVTRRKVEVDFGAGITDENNPPLLNNDIVFVQRNPLTVASDVLETFTSPFRQVLSLLTPFDLFD